MYGDRDYPCNWVGGEAASLAVPYSKAEDFAAAGYTPLVTPEGVQGMTRQFGNFSFTRVFQAVCHLKTPVHKCLPMLTIVLTGSRGTVISTCSGVRNIQARHIWLGYPDWIDPDRR